MLDEIAKAIIANDGVPIVGYFLSPSPEFRRYPEFAPSDRHDFWTEASLYIKEGFDRWDLDFEAWKFCFLPGQIASCLVIFFPSCSLFVAIYLDIDSK
ncbi:hypothetical protein Tco_0485947, partial [Tanacetum coccineum]